MSELFKIFGEQRAASGAAKPAEHEEHSVPVAAVSERPLDFAAIRAKLASSNGKRFWQSLEELARTPEYEAFVHHEFPHDPEKEPADETRSSETAAAGYFEIDGGFGGAFWVERLYEIAGAEDRALREGA